MPPRRGERCTAAALRSAVVACISIPVKSPRPPTTGGGTEPWYIGLTVLPPTLCAALASSVHLRGEPALGERLLHWRAYAGSVASSLVSGAPAVLPPLAPAPTDSFSLGVWLLNWRARAGMAAGCKTAGLDTSGTRASCSLRSRVRTRDEWRKVSLHVMDAIGVIWRRILNPRSIAVEPSKKTHCQGRSRPASMYKTEGGDRKRGRWGGVGDRGVGVGDRSMVRLQRESRSMRLGHHVSVDVLHVQYVLCLTHERWRRQLLC